ncbi:MAG: cytochrome P450 [Gammaproteobacteria bacterium]|nr:cytochrome P450 [Gammaproteobacteria bacterium]MCP5200908.1 cytochrome P450 [Gammaproteobacteria bacterium]
MSQPAVIHVALDAFWRDPYPVLAEMRARAPVAFVPELGAVLLTRRDDVFTCEKNVAVFSSWQPGGLMTRLMGENMMRKDGAPHQAERKQMFPSVSPVTVRDHWRERFVAHTSNVLDALAGTTEIDLVADYAMPVSAHALREITGLVNLTPERMNAVSQAMIDGCANYAGDTEVEARCHAATAEIDAAIDARLGEVEQAPDFGLLSVLSRAGQALDSVRANIKLAISGGQNEPRDAIAGTAWALLTHPEQLAAVRAGRATWQQAFEEYARWISPIGMSPRRIAAPFTWNGVDLEPESRVFLMFGSANRDETVFERADAYDLFRDNGRAIPFGAGPHFCAGAAASRCLIAEVALPLLFERYPRIELAGEVPFGGWAFRGPLRMPVRLGGG